MTNHYIDIRNSDVILIHGQQCRGECTPFPSNGCCGPRRPEGPRSSTWIPALPGRPPWRMSYVPLRSGTDIAFLGGMIKYILDNNKYFEEYVENYTNASFIVDEKFDFNDGLFSGYDPATSKYDKVTWAYQDWMTKGVPQKDPTLQNPHCVFCRC